MRVADALTEATATLAAGHVASPRVDAELLAAFVLGVRRGRLAAAAGELTAEQVRRFRQLVGARASRAPLQYLTGIAPFRHLELSVGEGVFVPRPETEALVEWGLRWLGRRPGAVVVDLCSGSGAIAASVAAEAAGSRVWAVEREPAALRWLRRNVDDLTAAGFAGGDQRGMVAGGDQRGTFAGGDQRGTFAGGDQHRTVHITVVEGDATDPAVLADLDGSVDLVLCNPPYVPEIGAAGLPPEVTEHDPRAAVFAGIDGLDVIRPLIGRMAGLLREGGAFAIEHDETHAYVVPTLVHAHGGYSDVELHHDLARRPRFTTATRSVGPSRMADLGS